MRVHLVRVHHVTMHPMCTQPVHVHVTERDPASLTVTVTVRDCR